jgi:hypothetical protein
MSDVMFLNMMSNPVNPVSSINRDLLISGLYSMENPETVIIMLVAE